MPPNCRFEVDDIEKEWLWKKFDLIFVRSMIGSISDWELFFKKAYEYSDFIHIYYIMKNGTC